MSVIFRIKMWAIGDPSGDMMNSYPTNRVVTSGAIPMLKIYRDSPQNYGQFHNVASCACLSHSLRQIRRLELFLRDPGHV